MVHHSLRKGHGAAASTGLNTNRSTPLLLLHYLQAKGDKSGKVLQAVLDRHTPSQLRPQASQQILVRLPVFFRPPQEQKPKSKQENLCGL